SRSQPGCGAPGHQAGEHPGVRRGGGRRGFRDRPRDRGGGCGDTDGHRTRGRHARGYEPGAGGGRRAPRRAKRGLHAAGRWAPEGAETLPDAGLAVGPPGYRSPEQATGAELLDGRSDVYSLGCVLYEMLAGHPPFLGTTAQEVLARHSLDAVPPLRTIRPELPPALERAVLKALAKSPADRFATAAAFSEALTRAGAPPSVARRARRGIV